ASEFTRAHELDPTSAGARRVLAELRRATGKSEEALALYREQLTADPQDANARTGLVLSLFDAGRREEAERELQSALTGEAKDLPLLVGASYWYSARGEGARALELAEKAVALEPRFGWAWARIAQGRALLALKRPLDAELALRAARRFGNFPTLDYELAASLASAGLYDEAAEALSRSFNIRDGQIETRLAGRVEAPVAIFADTDEVRALRQQVVESGRPLSILNVQRGVLSKVLRGRIEELAGWALYNQGQTAEAVVRLRRAVSVLPEHTQWWRTAEWRLGAALEATGGARDALAAYVRSYREQPDPTRRTVIEALYKRLNNGSTQGLDQLTGTPDEVATAAPSQLPTTPASAGTPAAQANVGAATDAKAAAPESGTPPASAEPTPAPASATP